MTDKTMTDTIKDIVRHTALPVREILPDLGRKLRQTPSVVLQAPPGAGKTTLVPLFLLSEGLAGNERATTGRILMLEPRRLAARAAARRMAAMIGEKVGETIGYKVRLDSRVSDKTRIEVVTEGVFIRYLQEDPSLDGIGLVIFDEFHERSLDTDLGLALTLDCQRGLREDLKLLIMSATLDGDRVAALLNNAPVITSAGRSYPVDIRYLDRPVQGAVEQAVAATVGRALREETGSVLAFLPGAAEIRRTAALIAEQAGNDILICPLFGQMSGEDQDRAIEPAPPGQRKVVLATDIAETSLTIDGIRIVVDSGLARRPHYDVQSGMSGLDTIRISRASADQRAGRAGRLEPGLCFRLWPEPEQRGLLPYTPPEITQADLTPLMLQLACWGVRDSGELRWLDSPDNAKIEAAREVLTSLGALDANGMITAHGRDMAALGMHPRLAHMVLKAREMGLGWLAVDVAALLSERDILKLREPEADFRLRLEALAMVAQNETGQARRLGADIAACRRVLRQAKQWMKELGIKKRPGQSLEKAGLCLALAYPERIAGNRQRLSASSQRQGQFQLAGGRGAVLPPEDSLAAEDFLAVASLDKGTRDARIFLAAPLHLYDLEDHFEDRITRETLIRWDTRSAAVLSQNRRLFGRLVLQDTPLADPPADLVATALIEGIRRMGLGCLPWDRKSLSLRERVAFIRQHRETNLPDLSEKALTDTLEDWLMPYLDGMRRKEDLGKLDLYAILTGLLGWHAQQELDRLAPPRITVPSGSSMAIDYSQDPPVLAVRMQEMFGTTETPAVLEGEVKLLVHLLSPAQRPLQVTQDLAGFWASGYETVKKEMKGRYPKHYWPDDPRQATPTRRTKPRS